MRYRLTFITGAAVGYVLGAAAGRERYEQLRRTAQRFAKNPNVRHATETATHGSREAASKAAGMVSSRIGDRLPPAMAARVNRLRDGSASEDDWGTTNT